MLFLTQEPPSFPEYRKTALGYFPCRRHYLGYADEAIKAFAIWSAVISEMILFRQYASNVTSASIGGRLNEPSSCAYYHD